MKANSIIATLAALATSACAVTLTLWTNNRGCSGTGATCSSLARNTCCYKPGTQNFGSLQYGGIHPAGSNAYAYQYISGNYCGNSVMGASPIPATGKKCEYTYPSEGDLAGAQWIVSSSRRSLEERGDTAHENITAVEAEWLWADGTTAWVISLAKEAQLKPNWIDSTASGVAHEAFFKKHADKVRPLNEG